MKATLVHYGDRVDIHAAGCRDLARYPASADAFDIDASSRGAIVETWWGDIIRTRLAQGDTPEEAREGLADDMHFYPCTRELAQ